VFKKKLKLERLVDRGISYVMLPAMLRVSKYMWLMFYLLLIFFLFHILISLLMPQTTSQATFKFFLSNYKSE